MKSIPTQRFNRGTSSLSPQRKSPKFSVWLRNHEALTKPEQNKLKTLSKLTLISCIHKERIKKLEETMGRNQFLSHFKFTPKEYQDFLQCEKELQFFDFHEIEKNVRKDVLNFSRRKQQRTFSSHTFSQSVNNNRVSNSRGSSSQLKIGNKVFSSRKDSRNVSNGVTTTRLKKGRDHTKTPDYKKKQTLTNNFGKYRTPKKQLISTRLEENRINVPKLRVDYTKHRHKRKKRRKKKSVKKKFQNIEKIKKSKIKKQFIPYGTNLTEKGSSNFNWGVFRQERKSIYNDFEVKNMADYEYKFEEQNSPTKGTFLRNKFNGGKGGVTEDLQVSDHDSSTVYYALPKSFYKLEDRDIQRFPNSRVYSPDYKDSHLSRAIDGFSQKMSLFREGGSPAARKLKKSRNYREFLSSRNFGGRQGRASAARKEGEDFLF